MEPVSFLKLLQQLLELLPVTDDRRIGNAQLNIGESERYTTALTEELIRANAVHHLSTAHH